MMNPFFFLRGALIRDLLLGGGLEASSLVQKAFLDDDDGKKRFPGFGTEGEKERERARSNKFFGFKIPPGFIIRLLNSNFLDRIRRVLTTSRVLSVLPIIII